MKNQGKVYKSPVHPGFREITNTNPVPTPIAEIIESKPGSLGEFWHKYQQSLLNQGRDKDIPSIQTLLVRFLVPGLGGSAPKSARASQKEIDAALDFLNQVGLEQLKHAQNLVEKVFDDLNLDKERRWQPRSYIKKMVDWAVSKHWIELDNEEREFIYRFKEVKKSRPDLREIVHTTRKISGSHMLGLFNEDYFVEVKQPKTSIWFWMPFMAEKVGLSILWAELAQLEPKHYLANRQLDEEVKQFTGFLTNTMNLRPPTVECNICNILRILGWLYRQKHIPLEQLRLTTIVPFIKPRNHLLFAWNYCNCLSLRFTSLSFVDSTSTN